MDWINSTIFPISWNINPTCWVFSPSLNFFVSDYVEWLAWIRVGSRCLIYLQPGTTPPFPVHPPACSILFRLNYNFLISHISMEDGVPSERPPLNTLSEPIDRKAKCWLCRPCSIPINWKQVARLSFVCPGLEVGASFISKCKLLKGGLNLSVSPLLDRASTSYVSSYLLSNIPVGCRSP